MNAIDYSWDEVSEDHPIALLARRKVQGEKMLVAKIHLSKGCHVAKHHHDSEQVSITVSGKMLWRLGDEGSPDYREVELGGGQVLVIPSNVPHSVDTLEDTEVFDILSPIGPMGVDNQES